MQYMFCKSHKFNKPIGKWNVANVKSFVAMFEDAKTV